MTIERAKQLAKKWANGYVCSLREGEAEEYHKLCFSALQYQQEHTSPCDLCAYNPPSSFDGKPCAMCPATSPTKGAEEE